MLDLRFSDVSPCELRIVTLHERFQCVSTFAHFYHLYISDHNTDIVQLVIFIFNWRMWHLDLMQ